MQSLSRGEITILIILWSLGFILIFTSKFDSVVPFIAAGVCFLLGVGIWLKARKKRPS